MKNKHSIYLLFLLVISFYSYGQARPDHTLNKTANQHAEIQPAKNGISFLAIGDFGRHGAFTQKEVARDMGTVAEILDLNFTISVGDNFYPNGVQSTQDYQWISSFESIYTHHLLHEPWFVALGNHDYEGNAQAQIDYSNISRRWQMPHRYFERLIEIDKGKYLQLLVIDTNPFIAKYKADPEKYLGIADQNTQEQLQWIETKLANNDPKIVWKIVVGHHPLYTGGKRKNDQETKDIQLLFEPILEKHKVDAYICGHEHDLQVIKRSDKNVMQFLSGAGSELRETGKIEGSLFAEAVPGFMAFTLTNNILKAYVIQSNEKDFKVIYQTEIKK